MRARAFALSTATKLLSSLVCARRRLLENLRRLAFRIVNETRTLRLGLIDLGKLLLLFASEALQKFFALSFQPSLLSYGKTHAVPAVGMTQNHAPDVRSGIRLTA